MLFFSLYTPDTLGRINLHSSKLLGKNAIQVYL